MALRGLACDPENNGCPLEVHFEDLHHKVPRWLGKLARESDMPEDYKKLVRDYISHPMNHIIGCRWVHANELDKATPAVLPTPEDMQAFLDSNTASGGIT